MAGADILNQADRHVGEKNQHEEIMGPAKPSDEHQDKNQKEDDVKEIKNVVANDLPIRFRGMAPSSVKKSFAFPLANLRLV